MTKIKEIIIKCDCIDTESLANLKLGLITAKDTYYDVARKLTGMEIYKPSEVENIRMQARKFDALLYEIGKIPPCH